MQKMECVDMKCFRFALKTPRKKDVQISEQMCFEQSGRRWKIWDIVSCYQHFFGYNIPNQYTYIQFHEAIMIFEC